MMPLAAAEPLKILYLGDNGHHLPKQRFDQLQPVFQARGIALTYTDKLSDLNAETLNKYSGLMVFANHTDWTADQEKALISYVEAGHGFIPVHCASYCFLKSQAYIDLVGAQFRSHTTGVFRTKAVKADHEVTQGCQPFASWDETYMHHKHNTKDRTVLEVRTDRDLEEPWTWVRTQGKGRVFYTAWGHDHRTWSHPGFHTLLERGTRWACGQKLDGVTTYMDRPEMTTIAPDAPKFEHVPAALPHYVPGANRKAQEKISTMQKPLSAADSIKHYVVPKDFEMRPFVTEEKLGSGKPICMTWDERGRLWLGLTYDYPNELQPEGEGRDRIVVCDDVDGDGVCDTVTVFAEKLSIPTSVLNVYGGILIHQAPHTLFLKDTDGDGKADLRVPLISGWKTHDTHAGPSNLRYGPDGWIYGMVGYSGFDGLIAGENFKFSQGLYRFKLHLKDGTPAVEKFEFLRSTSNNSWGVGFNEQGELFGSTANGCPLVHMSIPNRYFEKIRGLNPGALPNIALDNHIEPIVKEYRQVDWHGGFTAAAGCSVYTARTYPPEYWNNAVFVCEPTGHLCATLMLQPHSVTYAARYGWNLCASDDDWAAPIDAQVGPDGHMWVMDWYNIIVQHNPTPQGYNTGKGNAYEIPLRDKKYGRIYRVVYTKAKPEPRVNLQGAPDEKLKETLSHHNMTWRLHAQRLLAEREYISGTSIKLKKFNPETATLREKMRELMRIAEDKPSDSNASTVLNLMNDTAVLGDSTVAQILAIAAGVNDQVILKLAPTATINANAASILETVAKGFAGSPRRTELNEILIALKHSKNTVAVESILAGFAAGSGTKVDPVKLSEPGQAAVAALLGKLNGVSKARLVRCARVWGVAGLDATLAEIVKDQIAVLIDDKQPDGIRLDAARQILDVQPDSDAAAEQMIGIAVKASPKLGQGLFEILAKSQAKSLGASITVKLKDLPVSLRPAAMTIVLARPESTKAFLDAVEKGDQRFDILALDQKTALSVHPDKTIAERAKKILSQGGGLPDADRQKVIDQFMPIVKKTGDVGLGKKAFTQHCAKCHKHGSEGQTIGPDLTGFAVHPKAEILIHVLDPSRSVEGNFKQYIAKVSDGRVVMGLLSSETKTSVELLDAENKRQAIPREDLDSFKESPKSLMPEGFEKQMTEAELINLLEFMTQKGKYLPIPLDKAATIVSTRGMFFDSDGIQERLVFDDWKPKDFKGVPFVLVDPQEAKVKNMIMLHGPNGKIAPTMPKSVTLPCNTAAKAIHILGGIGGWSSQQPNPRGTTSVFVRLHLEDGTVEDIGLRDGVHFADYIRRFDVPGSELAFELKGKQQVRYLRVKPKTTGVIKSIELVKGDDKSAPIFCAITVETP